MVEEKLNVNIFIGSLCGGGAEKVVSELARNQPQDINLCLSLISQKNKVYQVGDVQLCVYDENASVNILSKLLSKIRPNIIYMMYQHYLYLKRNEFAASVSFLTYNNTINMLVSRLLHLPTVVSIRNNISEEHGFSIFSTAQRLLLKICSPYLIVNSEDNKNWLINHYHLDANKCICIYNPKDIESIHTLANIPINDDFFNTDETILLTVGRLSHQKGHVHLLRIFRSLREIIPCRLVICGIGPLESSLKEMADKMHISDYVLFTGFCDNPYMYMKNTDIFVFTSLFEGQPNALIEALICGCPIISADCDYGPREILGYGRYGILTKKLDGKIDNPLTTPLTCAERDMYEGIVYLIQNPSERKRFSSLTADQTPLFDKNKCVNMYYSVFRAVINGDSVVNIK